MTTPTDRNRLGEEESAYLRAHADNPVNWQPWDETAIETAREQDAPIFLSVGYSACHWCHVMAEESFEDEDIAALLNEHFVPIKVDREERPDLDRIYQTICQRVSGRGGWPLSVWLTPEGEPFQVGTYLPPEPKRGMPGFGDILSGIADAWDDPEERPNIEERAAEWTEAVTGELQEVPTQRGEVGESVLTDAAKAAVRGADWEEGGWGDGPKFPHAGRVHLLFRAHERAGRRLYREVAGEALDAMADGGMYDHVGGGFHRYATDRDWTVPHFEKMLYDQAELAGAYLAGYQITGEERYARVVEETLGFVERELTHDDGGFFSTLDAQSAAESGEREEGAFYVWTPAEVREAVAGVDEAADGEAPDTDSGGDGPPDTATLVCDRFGVTEAGNFEGATVLTVERSIADLAEAHEMDEALVRERLDDALAALREAREERERPPRDEKVLAGWNGLMISAFARNGLALDEDWTDPAADAMAFVREHLWDGDRLSRRYADGVVKIDGYLADYAFLARGALDLFGATGNVDHLVFALDLAAVIESEFWDESEGTLYFTAEGGESLIARPQELTDQSTPSSVGVAVEVLDALDHFRDDDTLATIAERVVETHASRVAADPLQHSSLTLAADTVTHGALELVLVAEGLPAEWREEFATHYLDPCLLAWRPPDEERLAAWVETLGLEETPPIWADRDQKNDEPTVYACRSRTCSPPRNDLGRGLGWADRML